MTGLRWPLTRHRCRSRPIVDLRWRVRSSWMAACLLGAWEVSVHEGPGVPGSLVGSEKALPFRAQLSTCEVAGRH